ncbi:MAG: hypothetical protein DRN20_05210 [Thermoplasmata archaeon]|nr:MAG: hypothetical protein DRN20_05210 [Thermoplasmata archaeon]
MGRDYENENRRPLWYKIMLLVVLSYVEEGKSVRYISNILGLARSKNNWIKRYKECGEKALRYMSRIPHRVNRITHISQCKTSANKLQG